MRKSAQRVTLILLVCLLVGVTSVSAKGRTERVTFHDDLEVNGQAIKKGTYKVTYDDEAKELTIFVDRSNVIKTAAHLEKREQKAKDTRFRTIAKNNSRALHSITFAGSAEAIVLDNRVARGAAGESAPQQ